MQWVNSQSGENVSGPSFGHVTRLTRNGEFVDWFPSLSGPMELVHRDHMVSFDDGCRDLGFQVDGFLVPLVVSVRRLRNVSRQVVQPGSHGLVLDRQGDRLLVGFLNMSDDELSDGELSGNELLGVFVQVWCQPGVDVVDLFQVQ